MPDKNGIPTLAEAFANRQPNELEKCLAAQKQPGYLPEGRYGEWALRALKFSDPERYMRVKAAQVNNLGDEVIAQILRGEA